MACNVLVTHSFSQHRIKFPPEKEAQWHSNYCMGNLRNECIFTAILGVLGV